MTRQKRKRPARRINGDVTAGLNQAKGDLLVAQCRLAALEDKLPYEDLIFCRRLIGSANDLLNELINEAKL